MPLNIPAGSVVYWDNHLPHATCRKLTSRDSREVFLFSYIPDIPLNRDYYKRQQEHKAAGLQPPAFYKGKGKSKSLKDKSK